METSSSTIASLLLRIFLCADKSLSFLHNYKILHLLRQFILSSFLFFLSLLPALFSSSQSPKSDDNPATAGVGSSGVSRALSQLLLLMNDIPVSSRKYEAVRSLAEKLIDGNLIERKSALTEVNCAVLSAAFARSLSQLEAAMAEQGWKSGGDDAAREGDLFVYYGKASRLVKGVKYYGRAAWRWAKVKGEVRRPWSSAEKLAAELLWLAQKMAASGCAEEAVSKWASAVKMAWLALSTEPRLQGSLVKLSAFLIREAKEMRKQEEDEEGSRATKMRMLMSWLPLLCCANNGTDAPVLSMAERAELETILEEVIWSLGEEEQEMVLSLWLHHFTYCPASDWPNLRSCYTRWYTASRATLLMHHHTSS
ncbi:uncharacterized protein LOC131019468 [Salvia miltiorrhiza]|uniref:uncharacterized protein LOC131019468 n=1 Tax=Salvia miltiorrhiza TaxID=226208 RepID=UPI0025AD4A36|nr:uncharacterized protein LOC131019468 [Salvia miltiorrhiza]